VSGDKEWIGTNRAWWDERAPAHATSRFYDLDGFRDGTTPDRLRPFEADELGVDPEGLELLHLQCHIGTDTLSWGRRGARVTGLDFSAPAIDVARELARDIGVDATFVVADVYDAVGALGGATYDVVYTGVGALSWLPRIDDWAEVAAALVRPGGVLYVVEIHPMLWSFDEDSPEPVVEWTYFGPITWDASSGTYTDGDITTEHNTTSERNWGFGSVLSAVVRAGLAVEHVAEHPIGVQQRWPWMEPVPGRADLWRVPSTRPQLPLLWSFRARRPARPAASASVQRMPRA
jgi:SAM-dependent methyltransferase